ncbi:Hypothetical protein NTJ_02089 [Nesidiocoris tenuis]|nr:Hypothetical protein NTJ_02089 [Nesidiocoris tenuis]
MTADSMGVLQTKKPNIYPTARDQYPVYRCPFQVVPEISLNNEDIKKFLDFKLEDNPETLHEILTRQGSPPVAAPAQWVRPDGVKRALWSRKRVVRPRKMSQYRVIPPYPPDEVASEASSSQSESEDYSESSLTTDVHTTAGAKPDQKAEPNLKHRWLDGTFCPKMRPLRWPDIRSIRTTQRRQRSDLLQRLEKARAEETYKHFILMKEEHLKTAEELQQERENLKREQEEEREREAERLRGLKVDRSPIKGALKSILTGLGDEEDLPIDIYELDKFCRQPLPNIDDLPAMMQQEEKANRGFVEYLDQNGLSEMFIGTLFMILSNAGPPENAKELLRLGLGGKPNETANVEDALQNIQETKDRIAELEKKRHDLRVKLLTVLKNNELPDEPEDPINDERPKRRMDYLLKEFRCKSRPNDVPIHEVYDLPEEAIKLLKYDVKAPGAEQYRRGYGKLQKDASTQQDYLP